MQETLILHQHLLNGESAILGCYRRVLSVREMLKKLRQDLKMLKSDMLKSTARFMLPSQVEADKMNTDFISIMLASFIISLVFNQRCSPDSSFRTL